MKESRKNSFRADGIESCFTYFNEISIIAQLANTMFERVLPDDMTQSQFGVLNWFVRVDTEATPGRLATAFQVTPGAMTNTLKRLESRQLVRIEADSTSGRRKIVTLTPKGRVARDDCIARLVPLLEEFAAEFPVKGIERDTRSLARTRQYLDEYRYRDQ